jgi:hypothetical protein
MSTRGRWWWLSSDRRTIEFRDLWRSQSYGASSLQVFRACFRRCREAGVSGRIESMSDAKAKVDTEPARGPVLLLECYRQSRSNESDKGHRSARRVCERTRREIKREIHNGRVIVGFAPSRARCWGRTRIESSVQKSENQNKDSGAPNGFTSNVQKRGSFRIVSLRSTSLSAWLVILWIIPAFSDT